MNILISNDDGYLAEGLSVLVKQLSKLGEITVVAPERNRSGASNSLTLDRPLSVKRAANGFFYVNGTPTDCVHIALTGLMKTMPDIVISGINEGANMGDDTIYSGTVAAAMEGHLLDIPAIAVSLAGIETDAAHHFACAAQVTLELVQHYLMCPLPATLLNVNVPNVSYQQLQGWQITRLGKRHKAEPVTQIQTPRGETVYWVGAAGPPFDGGAGTDFYAVSKHSVSISPIQVDLTKHSQLADLRTWLNQVKN